MASFDVEDTSSPKSAIMSVIILLIERSDGVATKMTDFLYLLQGLILQEQVGDSNFSKNPLPHGFPEGILQLKASQKTEIFLMLLNACGKVITTRIDLRGYIITFFQEHFEKFSQICLQFDASIQLLLYLTFYTCHHILSRLTSNSTMRLVGFLLEILKTDRNNQLTGHAIRILDFLLTIKPFVTKISLDPFQLSKLFELVPHCKHESLFVMLTKFVSKKQMRVLERFSQKILGLLEQRLIKEWQVCKSQDKTINQFIPLVLHCINEFFKNVGGLAEAFQAHKQSVSSVLSLLAEYKGIDFESEVFEFSALVIDSTPEATIFYNEIIEWMGLIFKDQDFDYTSITFPFISFFKRSRILVLNENQKNWKNLNFIHKLYLNNLETKIFVHRQKVPIDNLEMFSMIINFQILEFNFDEKNQEIQELASSLFDLLIKIVGLESDMFDQEESVKYCFIKISLSLLLLLHYYQETYLETFVQQKFMEKVFIKLLEALGDFYFNLNELDIQILKISLITVLNYSVEFGLGDDSVLNLVEILLGILDYKDNQTESGSMVDNSQNQDKNLLNKRENIRGKSKNRSKNRATDYSTQSLVDFNPFKKYQTASYSGKINLYNQESPMQKYKLKITDFLVSNVDEYSYLKTVLQSLNDKNPGFGDFLKDKLTIEYFQILRKVMATTMLVKNHKKLGIVEKTPRRMIKIRKKTKNNKNQL